MGKLIGFLIGLLFGPVGAFLGLLTGSLFDATRANATYFTFDQNDHFFQTIALLAAELTTNTNLLNKKMVLAVKETMIKRFGMMQAQGIMQYYKEYVKFGLSSQEKSQLYQVINQQYSDQQKQQVIMLLLNILKLKGYIQQHEIRALLNIANNMGINIPDYNTAWFENQGAQYDRYSYRQSYSSYQNSFQNDVNAYEVLDLKASATDEEVKKQYRELSKIYHPDKTSHLPEAEKKRSEEKMKKINNAYEQIKKARSIK